MNPIAIALQGIGYGALLVAVQGFLPPEPVLPWAPNFYGSGAAQDLRKQQLEEDEIILAVIQQFVLEG